MCLGRLVRQEVEQIHCHTNCSVLNVGNISFYGLEHFLEVKASPLSPLLPGCQQLILCRLFTLAPCLSLHRYLILPNAEANHVWYWLCWLSNGQDSPTALQQYFFASTITRKLYFFWLRNFLQQDNIFLSDRVKEAPWIKSNYPCVMLVIMLCFSRQRWEVCLTWKLCLWILVCFIIERHIFPRCSSVLRWAQTRGVF